MKSTSDTVEKLYIQCNSPGEISNWLKPVCEYLGAHFPTVSVTVLLTPCQYATGQEQQVALSYPCVDKVLAPSETIKRLLLPPYFIKKPKAAVLFLGGDPFYAKCWALKYRLPLFSYSERPLRGKFRKQFLRDVDGDLMFANRKLQKRSREALCRQYNLDPRFQYCVFFSSSRQQQFDALLPYYKEAALILQEKNPNVRSILNLSPFLKTKPETIDGVIVMNEVPLSDLAVFSDLLVTIPGTNTIEAAYHGLPAVVFVPLNKPEVLILDGLLYWIIRLPFLGTYIQRYILKKVREKITFFSLPNIISKQPIVPEYCEEITSHRVADIVEKLLKSPEELNQMKSQYHQLYDQKGILEKMIPKILKLPRI